MKLDYENVPDMISGKDLDYLTDMFNWNYNSYKSAIDHSSIANDQAICKILDKASTLFNSNMQEILDILERGGCNE